MTNQTTFKDANKALNDYLAEYGYEAPEADEYLNGLQFLRLELWAKEHNTQTVRLGIINRYDSDGDKPWIWDYSVEENRPELYNFGAAFWIPTGVDESTLVYLLDERDTSEYLGTKIDAQRIDKINDEIEKLGGHYLMWS